MSTCSNIELFSSMQSSESSSIFSEEAESYFIYLIIYSALPIDLRVPSFIAQSPVEKEKVQLRSNLGPQRLKQKRQEPFE
jgi:hypothetical protein